nr:LysR family transcriptional regulator [Marinicella sp. W31]MDC2878786.1 LysR family transcriptional regulator [Marinicella sp. W31]
MDRLTSMAVFVKVVDLGSFVAAANEMGLSPQMVSKHVVFLEDRLGATLLNRTTRKQSLSDIGRAYYERCKIILGEAEAAESLASDMRRHPKGLLRVNAPRTFGSLVLAPMVTRYLARFPDVEIDLVLEDRFADPVEEGYEIVIRIGNVPAPGLVAVPLAPYRLVVCAAPDYLARCGEPKKPADLVHHQCLVFGQSSLSRPSCWRFYEGGKETEVNVSGRIRSNDWLTLMRAAVEGYGVALGAELIMRDELAAGRLVRVLGGYAVPVRPVNAFYIAGRRPTAKVRSFLDAMVEAFGPEA